MPTPFAERRHVAHANLLPETLKMQKNPDVTVRMRGVMEKCTYCVQRLERGKYGAKIAATEVAQGRRVIETDSSFKPDGPPSAYRKPKDPQAAGYDLDDAGPRDRAGRHDRDGVPGRVPDAGDHVRQRARPEQPVYQAKKTEGEYLLLGELNTKPRTSYLPRLRNPNPEMV